MTLRAPSRGVQWLRWLVGAAFAVCAYVVVFRLACEGSLGDVLGARQLRVLLPVMAVFSVFAYETRWDGVVREKGDEKATIKGEGEEGDVSPSVVQPSTSNPQPQPSPPSSEVLSAPGEAEYAQARAMPHRALPDYDHDCEYLDMLEKSANLGYPRALAKLGEYALRKGWLVEAYFWMLMAEKRGWKNAAIVRADISRRWVQAGCPRERGNVTDWFSKERGSLSRAFLRRDCRVDMPYARKRLAEFAASGDKDALFLLGGDFTAQ